MATENIPLSSCFSCGALEQYSQQATDYASHVAEALQTPMVTLFAAVSAMWIVIQGYRLVLGTIDLKGVGVDMICWMFAGAGLSNTPALIQGVYTGALEVMSGSARAAFTAGGASLESGGYDGITLLALNAEMAVGKVFWVGQALISQSAMIDIMPKVIGVLLVIPYFVFVSLYVAQVVIAVFRVMVVATFSPFLMLCAAFKETRGMAAAGVRVLVSTILVLFACTVAISMAIYGVVSIKIPETSAEWDAFASFSNPQLLAIIILGWIGTGLMLEATSVANSIAGTMLSNGGALMMAGGVAASAAYARARLGQAGETANQNMNGWKSSPEARAQRAEAARQLVEKYKNANNPGSGK